jgi:hypothetical protein
MSHGVVECVGGEIGAQILVIIIIVSAYGKREIRLCRSICAGRQ